MLNTIAKKKKKTPAERDIKCWEEGCVPFRMMRLRGDI